MTDPLIPEPSGLPDADRLPIDPPEFDDAPLDLLSDCAPETEPHAQGIREIGIEEAERIAGRRLDRRRKYATTSDGKPDRTTGHLLFSLGRWTETCSGCHESEDGHPNGLYPYDEKAGCSVGAGCSECGYTGKRRVSMWLPHMEEDADDAF